MNAPKLLFRVRRKSDSQLYSTDKDGVSGFGLTGGEAVLFSREVAERFFRHSRFPITLEEVQA